MDDQKDRFSDKLHDVEKAREDQWAGSRIECFWKKSVPGNPLRSVARAAMRN
ncbi:MAG: hypothetical protein JOZ29_15155 [Deltaproteobacteria bacterium]|nr:hypothetical protein [Deltaproteobacteria bacterium]